MKPAPFELDRAGSAPDALSLLAAGAKPLAGGQSLMPMLNLRLARPPRLVDLKRVAALREASGDAATLRLGAGFTHAEIEDSIAPDPSRGLLPRVARGIAYRAVRNRGTLGGSLAHADPAADWVSVMPALDAVMVCLSPRGERRVPAAAFMLAPFTTALAADEILLAVEIPRLSDTARWGHRKVNRKTGEFAKAIGIAVRDPARGLARLVAGAVEAPPLRLPEAEAAWLAGGDVRAAAAAELSRLLAHLAPAPLALHQAAMQDAIEEAL